MQIWGINLALFVWQHPGFSKKEGCTLLSSSEYLCAGTFSWLDAVTSRLQGAVPANQQIVPAHCSNISIYIYLSFSHAHQNEQLRINIYYLKYNSIIVTI